MSHGSFPSFSRMKSTSILKCDSKSLGLRMKSADVAGLAIKFFSLSILFLLPIRPALIAAAGLVIVDLISGLIASIQEGKKITSSGLRRTIVKMLAYQSAIIIAFILESYLLDGLPVVKTVTGLIGVTEGKSFFENIHRITGIDFWSVLISKLNMPDTKHSGDNEE